VFLKWAFELIPPSVLVIVAVAIGTTGFASLAALGWYVGTVVIALFIVIAFYAVRLRLTSSVGIGKLLRGSSQALLMAFSTGSSVAAVPLTYEAATENLGASQESAALGVMVGGTFNHDGNSVYVTVSALFVAQAVGIPFDVGSGVMLVLMGVLASVGAAGVPHAGLVTLIAAFRVLKLPLEYVPLVVPVDWILDRCRTTVSVIGVLVSTCIVNHVEEPSADGEGLAMVDEAEARVEVSSLN